MKINLQLKSLFLLMLALLALLPTTGLAAFDPPEWQARAAEAFDLANESGLTNWQGSLPMLWTESDAVRRFLYLAPRVREDKIQQALEILNGIQEQAGTDSRVCALLATIEAYRGDRNALTYLVGENEQGRQDRRMNLIDLALYLRDWDLAERISIELESEGVEWATTYRRAILAGLKGNPLMAESLWQEAVAEGLPITQAAYKELYKAGQGSLVNPPTLHSKVKGYLDTLDYLSQRTISVNPYPTTFPEGLRNGIVAYETKAYQEAIQYWQAVTGPADVRFIAQCMIGEAQNRLGRYDEAIRLWDEIIKASPNFFLGYLGLAEAYRGKGLDPKSDACLTVGYRRTQSAFLLKNNAIGPGVVKEIRGTIEAAKITGHNALNISGDETGGADGFWVSWNYGRDWLWYPNYLHSFLVPSGDEYWIKGTRGLQGPLFPDQMLRSKAFVHPEAVGSLTVENTRCGETPMVRWEFNAPVALNFEYWTSGGGRMRVEESPETLHAFPLDNVEPGQDYHYRACVTKDGQEIELVEGKFSTEVAPFWVGITRPVWLFGKKTWQAIIPVYTSEFPVSAGQFRWARDEEAWSDWSLVKEQLILKLLPKSGLHTIRIQFRDEQGRLSPILREKVQKQAANMTLGSIPGVLQINGGDEATSERSVLLSLSRIGEKSMIRFSNDQYIWGPWNPVSEIFRWRLSGGDGPKTVFAQIREGEQIQATRSTLLLDSQKSDISDLAFEISPNLLSAAVWKTSKPVRCRFYWGRNKDDLRLIEEEEYTTDHQAVLGMMIDGPTIWRLEAQDRAGNLTVLTDGWLVGKPGVLPVPTVQWGSLQTKGDRQNITLQFSAIGPPPAAMRLCNQDRSWTAWQPFKTVLKWSLQPFAEQQWVKAQFRDEKGMVTPISSVKFTLDMRPPRVYGVQLQTTSDGLRISWKIDEKAKTWLLIQSESEAGFRDFQSLPGSESAMAGTIIIGRLPQGKYRIRLMAEDPAGNWNGSDWVAFEETESGIH